MFTNDGSTTGVHSLDSSIPKCSSRGVNQSQAPHSEMPKRCSSGEMKRAVREEMPWLNVQWSRSAGTTCFGATVIAGPALRRDFGRNLRRFSISCGVEIPAPASTV